MLGFKTFESARKLIAGIETVHMIKKGQMHCPDGLAVSAADYFVGPAKLIPEFKSSACGM